MKIGIIRFTLAILVTALLSFSLGRSVEYAQSYEAHSVNAQVKQIMAMLP